MPSIVDQTPDGNTERCPRCGHFPRLTRRTPARLARATAEASLRFHALQVHHLTLDELRVAS